MVRGLAAEAGGCAGINDLFGALSFEAFATCVNVAHQLGSGTARHVNRSRGIGGHVFVGGPSATHLGQGHRPRDWPQFFCPSKANSHHHAHAADQQPLDPSLDHHLMPVPTPKAPRIHGDMNFSAGGAICHVGPRIPRFHRCQRSEAQGYAPWLYSGFWGQAPHRAN